MLLFVNLYKDSFFIPSLQDAVFVVVVASRYQYKDPTALSAKSLANLNDFFFEKMNKITVHFYFLLQSSLHPLHLKQKHF